MEQGYGEYIYLEPGYWIVEHKTKAAELSRPKYAASWVTNLQVDFQVLALEHYLHSKGDTTPVQGVLINVLEKPRNAGPPTRKCRKCGAYAEYSMWGTTTTNKRVCPWCSNEQALTPLGATENYTPSYYRVVVQAPVQRAIATAYSIKAVWEQMIQLEGLGVQPQALGFPLFNYRSCVHPIYGPCEFFEPHSMWTGAQEGPLYKIKEDPIAYTKE
jgi:hypothetical protein